MLVLLLLLTGPAEDVLEARLTATVQAGQTDVRVHMRYELSVSDELRTVPVSFLEIGRTSVVNLTVDGVEQELDRSAAPRVEARLDVRDGVLELDYDVIDAVTTNGISLPVAVVGIKQKEARAATFRADVSLPAELEHLDRFPPTDDLPVVPGFVSYGVSGVKAPFRDRPGVAFWGLFAVFGWIVIGYVIWMRHRERLER